MRNNSLKCKYQIIAFVLVLLVAVLSGCEKVKKTSAQSVDSSEVSSEYMENQSEVKQNSAEDSTDKKTATEENKTTVTEKQNTKTESKPSVNSSTPKSEQETTEISSLQQQETEIPPENKPPESEPVSKNATAGDAREIADILIEKINEIRVEQRAAPAIKLVGMTEYAIYRSRQLITNFAHDTKDERTAATALKYGKYTNPLDFGGTGNPFYSAQSREAIAFGGYAGSVNYIAQSLARQIHDSSNHWAYVGSAEYPYIAVGITLDSRTWYCDIAMSKTNEYEK